jgi:hypothetical protein
VAMLPNPQWNHFTKSQVQKALQSQPARPSFLLQHPSKYLLEPDHPWRPGWSNEIRREAVTAAAGTPDTQVEAKVVTAITATTVGTTGAAAITTIGIEVETGIEVGTGAAQEAGKAGITTTADRQPGFQSTGAQWRRKRHTQHLPHERTAGRAVGRVASRPGFRLG